MNQILAVLAILLVIMMQAGCPAAPSQVKTLKPVAPDSHTKPAEEPKLAKKKEEKTPPHNPPKADTPKTDAPPEPKVPPEPQPSQPQPEAKVPPQAGTPPEPEAPPAQEPKSSDPLRNATQVPEPKPWMPAQPGAQPQPGARPSAGTTEEDEPEAADTNAKYTLGDEPFVYLNIFGNNPAARSDLDLNNGNVYLHCKNDEHGAIHLLISKGHLISMLIDGELRILGKSGYLLVIYYTFSENQNPESISFECSALRKTKP